MKKTMIKSVLTMLSVLFVLNANAYDAEINGIYYNFSSEQKTAEVVLGVYYDNMPYYQVEENPYTGDFVIPENVKYNGEIYTVTSIGKWAFFNSKITSITIPSTIKKIDSNAFDWCYSMTAVYITDLKAWCNIVFSKDMDNECHITEYDGNTSNPLTCAHYLYLNGEKIDNLIIPGFITKVGFSAFSGIKVNSLTVPNGVTSIDGYAFFHSTIGNIEIPNSVTSIGDFAFAWSNLQSITMSDGIQSMGTAAFEHSTLTAFSIPKSMKSIPDRLFRASSLASVEIPEGVLSIGEMSFAECTSLTKVTIPSSIQVIGYYAFAGFYHNLEVRISDLSTWCNTSFSGSYDYEPFYETPYSIYLNGAEMTTLEIPENVTSINSGAFQDCISLKSVIIPDHVTSIGYSTFKGCANLESVTIGKGVASIESDTFSDCSSLNTLTLPDGITSIGSGAFRRCSSLTSITIPESVTSIGANAFEDCSNMASITILNSAASIGSRAFHNTAWFNNQKDGLLYINTTACAYKGKMPEKAEVVLKEGTTSLASGLFSGFKELASVSIPNSVTSISDNAFYGCSGLTAIEIPNSVTSIGNSAFYYCI